MLVRQRSRVRTKYLKAILHSTLLLLLYLQEIHSYFMHKNVNQSNKLVNLPWVHNSVLYTQSIYGE